MITLGCFFLKLLLVNPMSKIHTLFLLLYTTTCVAFASAKEAPKMHLIWQMSKEYRFEEDWLAELLSGIAYDEVTDGNFEVFMDNAIVVVSSNTGVFANDSPKQQAYFTKFHELNYNFGIIHLSDELYHAATDFYPFAKFVFRNYWHKDFAQMDNVLIFPLGYKAEFWLNYPKPRFKKPSQRNYTWSFAGQVQRKPTREYMVAHLKTVPNHYIYEIAKWGDPNALKVDDYRNLLMDTIFAPCPRGFWNIDSFRVWEALECGCIPIVEKTPIDYFTNFLGAHPFLSVETWDEAPNLMHTLLEDPIALEERQKQCQQWWHNYKRGLKVEMKSIINKG